MKITLQRPTDAHGFSCSALTKRKNPSRCFWKGESPSRGQKAGYRGHGRGPAQHRGMAQVVHERHRGPNVPGRHDALRTAGAAAKRSAWGGGLHHLLSDGNTEEAWQQILQVALFGDEVLSSQTIVKEHLDFGLSKDFKNLKWALNWGNETSLGGHNTLTAFNRSQKQIL